MDHAEALDDSARREPSPFSTFLVARAHALVAYGRGSRDAASLNELLRLRHEGRRLRFLYTPQAIDAAIMGQANRAE
ncbi:hypothetical protein PTKU46_54090 [Paraburkholderia terrae]